MASLRKLKTMWQIRFYDAERSPERKPVTYPLEAYTRREIEAKQTELEYLYNEGKWDPWRDGHPGRTRGGHDWAVAEAVEAYCEHKRALGRRGQRGGWNDTTLKNYRPNLKAFADEFDDRKTVEALTTEDFAAWVFGPGRAEATSRTYLRMLKTFVRWLSEERGVDMADLPRGMQPPRERIKDYPTEDDVRAVVRAHRQRVIEKTNARYVPREGPRSPLVTWHYSLAFRLAFYQGLRLGEIAQLVPEAVDIDRQRLAVGLGYVPKGRHEKVITITPPALPILECLVSAARRLGRRRLLGIKKKRVFSDAWREARRRAFPAREKLTFHSLRRGATVYWLEHGVDPRDMQTILRHADRSVMERHYDQHVHDGTRDRINALYEGK